MELAKQVSTSRVQGRRRKGAPLGTEIFLTPAQKRQVKQITRAPVELKRFDTYNGSFSLNAIGTGTSFAITDIPQGDSDATHDGDQCALRKLHVKFAIWMTATGLSTNTNNGARAVVWQWKPMSTGSNPVPSDLFENTLGSSYYYADYHHDYIRAGELKILYDKSFALCSGVSYVNEDIDIPLSGKIQWSNTAGTLKANGLYITFVTDDQVNPSPVGSCHTRVYFTDQ